jgi:stage II sporulation protein D
VIRASACALLALLLQPALAVRAEEIKIEVLRGRPRARVSGSRLFATEGTSGAPVRLSGAVAHQLEARDGRLTLDGRPIRSPLVLRTTAPPTAGAAPEAAPQAAAKAAPEAAAPLLQIGGRSLPGRLEVWAEPAGLVVVNALDLEEYVAAVVASEVPARWPAAALQAQAVAARTFALAQKIQVGAGARAHLGASVLDQVYAGAAHPQASSRAAAQATHGEVLTFDSAPIEAWFSSSCGGLSESAEAAFGLPPGSAPYATSQSDGDADDGAPSQRWTVRRPLAAIAKKLRADGRVRGELAGLDVAERTGSGRARTIRLELRGGATLSMSASDFRQLVGYSALPSLQFSVGLERGAAVFRGTGSGHGVGLCQWGARGRAARGESYRDVLSHYYPGAEVRRLY